MELDSAIVHNLSREDLQLQWSEILHFEMPLPITSKDKKYEILCQSLMFENLVELISHASIVLF